MGRYEGQYQYIAILFIDCSNETEEIVKKEPPKTPQEANAQLGNPATIVLGSSSVPWMGY